MQRRLATCQPKIVAVISDRPGAFGLERARQAGIPAVCLPFAPFRGQPDARHDYDRALADTVAGFRPDWIVLAGWMRLLSRAFLDRFSDQVVNLHPAQPGAFPGTARHRTGLRAFQQGQISDTGVMVHLVPDEGVDDGPVLVWEAVPIMIDDTLADLQARIHAVEHRLLPDTLRRLIVGEPR